MSSEKVLILNQINANKVKIFLIQIGLYMMDLKNLLKESKSPYLSGYIETKDI